MFSVHKTTILLTAIAGIAITQGCGGKAQSTANATGETFSNAAHKTGATIYEAGYISSKQQSSAVRDSAELQQLDPAMEKRQWSQSVAYLPNGATVAGPTGFAYEPRRDQNKYKFYYADTGNFFLNLVTLPYTLYKTPPLSEQTFAGERLSGTYTGVPPLPPEAIEPPPVTPVETAPPAPEAPAAPETPAPETPAPQTPAPAEQPAAPSTQPG